MASLPAVVAAPAKLTLSLRIAGLRADGYHLIDAEMVTLDLADALELGELPAGPSEPIGRTSVEMVDGRTGLPIHARASRHQPGRPGPHGPGGAPGTFGCVKHIPPGAGLGGGSSDAAAVLRGPGSTISRPPPSLGADVPFCLVGGRARVRGIGEIVEPLPVRGPHLHLADATLRLLDAGRVPALGRARRAPRPRHRRELRGPVNDLEPAALLVEPRLAEWRDRLAARHRPGPPLGGQRLDLVRRGRRSPATDRVVVRTVPAPA